jgi:hypothetical protein
MASNELPGVHLNDHLAGSAAGTDLDRLIERARGQRRALEPHRLAAAVQSFST